MNWNLDQFKKALSVKNEVSAWIITTEHTNRRERYFMLDREELVVDQDREIHSHSISAKIFVKLPKPGRQGEMNQKFFPSLPLDRQIDSAIQAALQTDHQTWSLPTEIPAQLPGLASSDPRIAEDIEKAMAQATGKIDASVKKKRATDFNSAELFLSNHNRELHLSNGLTHRSSQTRIYVEAAYSFSKPDAQGQIQSDEYLSTCWAVNLDDLPIEKIFDETSERASRSLDIAKPVTGKYPVIVDSETLAMLFNDHISHVSAANAYNSLPFTKVGDELIMGATGDLISITLDPTLSFGAETNAVSDQGVAQKPIRLVEKNQVTATTADKQYADYLGIPPTTIRGNVVVEPGTMTHQELTKMAPQVIEILQFSALFTDSNSGTFSSEIRLAKLYDNTTGKVSYLKGGSLSGSIQENFKGIRFTKNLVKRAHFSSNSPEGHGYYGPDFAVLSDVSIVG